MAETFTRDPKKNADNRVWADYLLPQIKNSRGLITSYLYDDSGTLKLKPGVIGINDGTNEGTVTVTADKTISLDLCSVSHWIKIEMSVSGTTAIFTASDLSGGTDPAALHATFKNAWRGDRGGFYITTTKRCIGLAWKNAAGVLEGIVNCLPFIDGWSGYCQSNDAYDVPYSFEKNINEKTEGSPNTYRYELYKTAADVWLTKKIITKIIELGDWNMNVTDNISITHGLTTSNILNINVMIRNDDDTWRLVLNCESGSYFKISTTSFLLYRAAGGLFDNANYQATSFNRGWVHFTYEE